MNELFRVDSLDEITYDHFEMACIAAMSESEELKGLLGVPCGSDYFALPRKRQGSDHSSQLVSYAFPSYHFPKRYLAHLRPY